MSGLRGYSPRLASAINRMLRAKDTEEYRMAKREAVAEITGYDVTTVEPVETAHTGRFGLPLFMPVLFEAFDSTVKDLLLEDAIVEINRSKNIVITEVQGRDTSFKEFINNGDYVLKISGTLATDGIEYPMKRVKELQKYLEHKGSIKVVHELLNELGIYEIVITDYGFPKVPFVNWQPYSINAISEEPFELILDE